MHTACVVNSAVRPFHLHPDTAAATYDFCMQEHCLVSVEVATGKSDKSNNPSNAELMLASGYRFRFVMNSIFGALSFCFELIESGLSVSECKFRS